MNEYTSENKSRVRYENESVDSINIFYRESGNPSKQTLFYFMVFHHPLINTESFFLAWMMSFT